MKESRGGDTEAKAFLLRYKSGIAEAKERAIREKRGGLKDAYSINQLKEELSQLSQHWLGMDSKPGKKAAEISKSLVIAEGKLNADAIRLSVWQKSLTDMPTYDEYQCCGFRGGCKDDMFGYILNPAIQLVKLGAGDKSAIAIVASTTDIRGKRVLLVDSFESGSHIFARKEVSQVALEGLKEYAHEAGFDELLVSADAHNNAPQEFYENIKGECIRKKLKLGSDVTEPYLETNIDLAKGKQFILRE